MGSGQVTVRVGLTSLDDIDDEVVALVQGAHVGTASAQRPRVAPTRVALDAPTHADRTLAHRNVELPDGGVAR